MDIFDDGIFKAERDRDDLPTVEDNSILENLGRSRAKKRLFVKEDDTDRLKLPPFKPCFIPTEVQISLYKASVIGRNDAEEFIKKSGIKKCTTSVLSSGIFTSTSKLSTVPKKRTKVCSKLDTPNKVGLTPKIDGVLDTPKMNKSNCKSVAPLSDIRSLVESPLLNTPVLDSFARSDTSASPELNDVACTQSKSSVILNGVVAFVDIGTDLENRSKDVKDMLLSLGAEVNRYFTKKVSIVIFKDGLMSTYTRAKLWKVPLVSILWIEACREKLEIVPIKLHPPLGIDEYETALTYDLFKY